MEKNPGRPFLSACLIVKNEEQNIERCLKSIRDIVDEIIIVDTGSTDRTMEIARSYGARIFEHPWQNDFSLHRNQSIDYAQGQWVFIIDADEELESYLKDKSGLRKELHSFLKQIPLQGIAAGLVLKDIQSGQVSMTFNTTRFFRKGEVYYKGIIHNSPQISTGQSVLCEFAGIRHYGYDLNEEQREAKYLRTNTLLKKRLQDNFHDYEAMFYLCQQHAEGGRNNQEAIKWGERYLAAKQELDKLNIFNESIYYTLFRLYIHAKKRDDAKRVLTLGLKALPNDLDLALAVMEFGVFDNDVEIKIEGANAFLKLFDQLTKNPTLKGNRFIYSHSIEGLAYVLYHKSLTYLCEGTNAFNQMLQTLEKTSPAIRIGFLQDFQRAIDSANIPLSLAMKEESNNNLNVVTTTINEGGNL